MKRLALIAGCLLATTAVQAAYSGYTYQRLITVSSTNVSNVLGTLANFPVLVSTNDVSLSTTTGSGGRLNSSGLDLIFSTMSDCSFALHWDTETVQNVGVSTFNAWVNVPLLTTATLTAATFYMCYGNSGVTTYQGVSTATWDANFKGVWHLPNGTTLYGVDSTSGTHNLTNVSSLATATTGEIDGGALFGGTGEMTAADSTDLEPTVFTISMWIKSSNTGTNTVLFEKDNATGYTVQNISGNTIYTKVHANGTNTTVTVIDGTWHYYTFTYNGTSTGKAYVDGIDRTSASGGINPTYSTGVLDIGSRGGAAGFKGTLDEIRLSNSIRSSDWISTEYNNQNSPSTFVTIGAETTSGGAVTPNAFFFGEF